MLVLRDIFLEIIKDLELFVEGYQSVQLVLKLDFSLLKSELELVLLALIEHSLCETLGCHGAGDLGGGGCHAIGSGGAALLAHFYC